MRFAVAILCTALLNGAVLAAPSAPPDWKQPEVAYSATRSESVMGIATSETVYFDQGRERSEQLIQGKLYISIYNPKDKGLYVFVPGDKQVKKSCLDFEELRSSAKTEGRVKSEALGRETVQGEKVTKYRVETLDGRRWYTSFEWVTDDGIVMRSTTAKGAFEFELSDLRRGPQPPELFELSDGIEIAPDPIFCKDK